MSNNTIEPILIHDTIKENVNLDNWYAISNEDGVFCYANNLQNAHQIQDLFTLKCGLNKINYLKTVVEKQEDLIIDLQEKLNSQKNNN